MVIMYRGKFTVGIALIGVMAGGSNAIVSANAIGDYSYVNARDIVTQGVQIARCVTGLGPSDTEDNSDVGGVYFNGSGIPNVGCNDPSMPIIRQQPAGNLNNLGVINIMQCRAFTTTVEGIYTCTMINSSMVEQSIRFGVFFTARSELFAIDLHISLLYLSFYTAAPVIDTPSSSAVMINVGDPLILNCTSSRSPPDIFTWRKDNSSTVLQSISITELDYTSTSAVFHAKYSIDNVTTSDSGTYTCTVTNPIGSNSTTITVVVIGKLLM